MGRRLIGPKVDFRLPEDVIEQVKTWANEEGVPDDEKFRQLMVAKVDEEMLRRATPPRGVRPLKVGSGGSGCAFSEGSV